MISYLSFIVTMSLSCTVSEIFSLISQNLKTSRDHDHAQSSDSLQSQCYIVTWQTSLKITNFEVTSFNDSRDILGETENLIGSRDHNHAPFMDRLSSVGWD